ncbi:unnamed protein product [Linum trigynum]|uniref:Phosphomannose isomerase type I catalytic domain-containing protein n=1 Tax=Linum trigynum TaxID=586398 RepID=A0AAV2CE47_9ROSI
MDSFEFVKNHCPLRRMRCSIQHYDWGRMGQDSLVEKVYALNSGFEIQLNKPYAEFWMGMVPLLTPTLTPN